jgi:uncharacterized membrane-anchored protein YhcB (DUF1043 family)
MESVIERILHLLAWLGIGIIIVFVIGFWLFHLLKKDAEQRDKLEAEAKKKDYQE